MDYIELMKDLRLELAAEYLVMAAMLAEIKSRMLLPRPVVDESEEDDPRAELIRRLQEYERFKKAAADMDKLPRVGRDLFPVESGPGKTEYPATAADRPCRSCCWRPRRCSSRASLFTHHHVQMGTAVGARTSRSCWSSVRAHEFTEFTRMFSVEEGRMGVVVTLLAVLELIKESLIELVQSEPFAPIYIKAATRVAEPAVAADERATGTN